MRILVTGSALPLKKLQLDRTRVTKAGMERFRQTVPGCNVSGVALVSSSRTSPGPVAPAAPESPTQPANTNSSTTLAASDDPVRQAVGWCVSRGFSLHIISGGGPKPIRNPADVPDGPLQVGSLIISKNRPIESEDWHHLKALRGLNSLVARDGRFDDAALAHLADSPSLKTLQLLDTSVTGAGLQRLPPMPALEDLVLGTQNPQRRATGITDEALIYVSRSPKLRKLVLSSCEITDDGLEALTNLDGLRELSLRHCRLTDSAIEHLSDLNLQTLHL